MGDDLFPGFDSHWIDCDAGRVFARSGGEGPPVALIHGFPQTHVMWRRLAPALAKTNRVVCLDLRGYGWSSAPASEGGRAYAKREMGRDVVAVMEALGHVAFAVVGHDRGARVGYRLALDQPGRVERLALLDILPTIEVWRLIEAGSVPAAHWAFLSRPAPAPETDISRDPIAYFEGLMAKWTATGDLKPFDRAALHAYRQGFNEPNRIHAMCEDYRAGATIDREDDAADLTAGRVIRCPTLIVWGQFYLTGRGAPPLEVWRRTFAPNAVGAETSGGHFVAEEAPEETLAALRAFLQEAS